MSRNILIVCGRFNEMITKALLGGATDTLAGAGLRESEIEVLWVPGAFEMPVTAKHAAESQRFSAIICLGAVIKGETPHFDYVAGQAAAGLMNVSLTTGVPVVFGVLTTDTVEQALNRAGLKYGNKGSDAAQTALQMCETIRKISEWRGKK